jgi:hypothetical protein
MSTDFARLDLLLRRRGTIEYALGMAVHVRRRRAVPGVQE